VTVDYDDIQGTILQGYRVDHARHFVLQVIDAAGARAFLGSLVDPSSGMPQITTAARWTVKPTSFLNLGITATGLAELGQPTSGFPASFTLGATSATTATLVGDVGDSAPANWVDGLADGANVHVILSLWVHRDVDVLEQVSATLRSAFAGALTELAAQDATALPANKVHFGYTDNISQPTVAGAPPSKHPRPDDQPIAPTGEFLLGYPNQNDSVYRVTPESLSKNSSFGVFRLLEQDVAGFDAWLTADAPQAGIDVEMLAAKVCGRWRNGVPLVLSPTTATPQPPLRPEEINDYTYVPADTYGYSCPVGAHMRRCNPRNEQVIAGGSLHRIIRRAMPYGPPYDPAQPDDVARGLVGWFINADISNQFELIMSQWVNGSTFVMSPPPPPPPPSPAPNPVNNISGQDVILGINDPAASSFTLSTAASGTTPFSNQKLTGFGPFVTTRGGAYCYLPSINALKVISASAPPAR
jgi:Dyp-type peroxidase family